MDNISNYAYMTFVERNSVLLLFLTVFISAFFIRFILSRAKKNPMLYSFVFLHALIIVWSAGLILEELSIHREVWLRWGSLYISYIGICFFSFGWLLFCGYFTKCGFTLKRVYIILLSIPSFIFYFLLITNRYHQLFYILPEDSRRELGPAYWILVAVSYLYISTGFILLFRHALKSKGLVKIQTLLIFSSCIVMFALNILRIVYQFSIETTPITVSMATSIIFTYASVKYRLFNIVPMSIMTFIESMEQGILIVDSGSMIVGYNKTLTDIFTDHRLICENESVGPFMNYLRSISIAGGGLDKIMNALESEAYKVVNSHLEINDPKRRYYNVKIQPVTGNRGKLLGKIISFDDATELHFLNEELMGKNAVLQVMNDNLNEANEVLLDHALSIEELSITRERNRILNEMHDSIGQTYTVILSLITLCKAAIGNTLKAEKVLNDMSQVTRDGLNEIRASIYNQRNRDIEVNSLSNTLEKLFQFYNKSDIAVQLMIEGTPQNISYDVRYTIYRICQEALTNSLKHGLANEVYVIIEYKTRSLRIFILDNGKGCLDVVKGMGLTGIEERVHNLNGTISYGSQEDSAGFYIQIELPV